MPAGRWRPLTARTCSRLAASSAKAKRRCWRAIARWRAPTWDCDVLATASLCSAVPTPARRVTGKRRQATYNRRQARNNRRGDAMKVFMFHLMPYAHLDMGYADKYRAAWVVLPNTYFDLKKGHELYNRSLDELELAAELGFDGISV